MFNCQQIYSFNELVRNEKKYLLKLYLRMHNYF